MKKKEKIITEEYVRSLTASELLKEQQTWTATQWQQYLCPNGTMTLEEVVEYTDKLIDKVFDGDESNI